MLLITSMSTTINYCVMWTWSETRFLLVECFIDCTHAVGHKSLPFILTEKLLLKPLRFFFENDDESRWMNREQLKMAWKNARKEIAKHKFCELKFCDIKDIHKKYALLATLDNDDDRRPFRLLILAKEMKNASNEKSQKAYLIVRQSSGN